MKSTWFPINNNSSGSSFQCVKPNVIRLMRMWSHNADVRMKQKNKKQKVALDVVDVRDWWKTTCCVCVEAAKVKSTPRVKSFSPCGENTHVLWPSAPPPPLHHTLTVVCSVRGVCVCVSPRPTKLSGRCSRENASLEVIFVLVFIQVQVAVRTGDLKEVSLCQAQVVGDVLPQRAHGILVPEQKHVEKNPSQGR